MVPFFGSLIDKKKDNASSAKSTSAVILTFSDVAIKLHQYHYDINELTIPQIELYYERIVSNEIEEKIRSEERLLTLMLTSKSTMAPEGKDVIKNFFNSCSEFYHKCNMKRKKIMGIRDGKLKEKE